MTVPQRILTAQVDWAELNPDEFVYVPCNICGTFDFIILASIVINCFEFFIVKCKSCGLIWRNPLLGQTFSRSLYSDKYFSVDDNFPQIVDQVGISDMDEESRKFRDEISKEVVQSWINFGILPKDKTGKPKKFLEIGGGRGYLQQAASEEGWETLGLEISQHGIRENVQKNLLPILLDELCTRYTPSYKNYFDLIVFYDFLEHMDDPSRVLRMMNFLLSDNGHIIFRIPETKSCPRYHLIDHIWHFPLDALDVLLLKENFDIFHAHYSGSFKASNGETYENVTFYARKLDITPPSRKLIIKPNPLDEWLKNYGKKDSRNA